MFKHYNAFFNLVVLYSALRNPLFLPPKKTGAARLKSAGVFMYPCLLKWAPSMNTAECFLYTRKG